jgi:hypothetical protein
MVSMTPAPNRRWFAYSLRTLFVVVTVFGVFGGWLVWQVHVIRERCDLVERINDDGGFAGTAVISGKTMRGETVCRLSVPRPGDRFLYPVGWFRRLMGDIPITHVQIPTESVIELGRIQATFPEANISVDGPKP